MRINQLRQADLNLLVVFTVLAEERNVSRAAERLLVSQPAVSRALARLREMFHDDLLVRTAKGYEPTPQGQRLMRELEVMLPKLDRLLSGPSFDPSVEHANFRIAATDNATAVLAPVICRDVLPNAKKVRIDFTAWRPEQVFDELMRGSVDLVLSANTVEVPSQLQNQMIYDEEFVCVVDAKSRLRRQLTIGEYMAAEHVSVSIQGGSQVIPDKPLEAKGYRRKIAMHVPYHEAAIRCVCGTKLIATVPRRLAEGSLNGAGAVRILAPPPEIGGFRYVMTWHPRVNTDAAHVWLRATMREVGEAVSRQAWRR
jgi:DNA-binding transcriptional LysR family regulator